MKSLNDIQEKLKEAKPKCKWCGEELNSSIEYYPHEGGVELEGFKNKQWLYVTCSCGYQWALHKLNLS